MARPKLNFSKVLIGILIIAFCVLRLWNAVDWFSFNFDEEYQAFLAWSQVQNFHPIWIGVSASNFGFYLGPAFTYLNAILFKISGGDLASLAIFSPLLGIATSFSIYYITSKIFTKKAAIFAMLIYGFSALMNIFDRRFWNPTPIPFITVWLLYSLYKANKDSRWFILTSVLMAISLHIHLSLVAFWPLILFIIFKNIKKISFKSWFLSISTYLIIVSPMIIFDINHNFDNLLGPVRYVFSSKGDGLSFSTSVISGNFRSIGTALSRFWFIKPFATVQEEMLLGIHSGMTKGYWKLSVISLVILGWLLIKQKRDKNLRILLFATLSILAAFLFYPSPACEYFLVSFFALFAIIVGLFLSQTPFRLSITLLGIYILINSFAVLTINQDRFGLTVRRQLVLETMSIVKDEPFAVEIPEIGSSTYPQYAGWCFMYRVYGRIPVKCQADDYFGWILGESTSDLLPKYKIIIMEDREYISEAKPVEVFQKGAFNIYIFKNNPK